MFTGDQRNMSAVEFILKREMEQYCLHGQAISVVRHCLDDADAALL